MTNELDVKLQEAAERYAEIAIDAGISLSRFKQHAWLTIVNSALKRTKGNQCRAARLIQAHRNTLARPPKA